MELSLRPISFIQDYDFLRFLYGTTRLAELSLVPWNDEQKLSFIDFQFKAQHQHYQTFFPEASYDLILLDNQPAGRLYVLRKDDEIRIIDINLAPKFRQTGVGKYYVNSLMTEAAAKKLPLRIFLESMNPYFPVFERWGFVKIRTDDGFYHLMEWNSENNKTQ